MSKKTVLFSLFLTIFISYSFLGYAQESKNSNLRNCNEVKELLGIRKNNLVNYNKSKKQAFSDISSSLNSLSENNKLSKKDEQRISSFKEEYSNLLFDRDDLVNRTENLLKLNCEIDKKTYSNRLVLINNLFKNQIKKEKKLSKDFSQNIKPALERGSR